MKDRVKRAIIKAWHYQNPPLQPKGRTVGFWGAIVGPNSLWPWSIYLLGPKAWAEKGYSPESIIQVQNSLGTQPRTIQSSACPGSHRKEGQKRYRNSLGKNLKISVSIEKGTLESITTRESCPYCYSILCTWQSHTLQLLQPPPTTLGMGWWDKYQSWNADPTRGRRIRNTG